MYRKLPSGRASIALRLTRVAPLELLARDTNDIHLLCQNARTYNEDGSLLYQDANDIEGEEL